MAPIGGCYTELLGYGTKHVFRMGSWQRTWGACISYEAPGYGTNRGLLHGVAGVAGHVFRMESWQCTGCARISYDAPGYGTNRGLPHGVAGVAGHVFRMGGWQRTWGACISYDAWGCGTKHVFCMNSIRVTLHVFCMPQSFFANFYTMLSLHVSCMTHRAKPTSMYSV